VAIAGCHAAERPQYELSDRNPGDLLLYSLPFRGETGIERA
jgi:hypothetical protein